MFADDHVVRNLHEIVDLHVFLNPGAPKTRAINCRVRTDFHIIIDLHNPDLGNFALSPVFEFESETIGANDCAAVNDHARTDLGSFADRDVRINETLSSDLRFVT